MLRHCNRMLHTYLSRQLQIAQLSWPTMIILG